MQVFSDGSTIVVSEDGPDEEQSFALPLTEGELYPWELIPTPTRRVFNEELQGYVEVPIKSTSTLKSVLSEEPVWYGYLDC
jgi:hypothetical protein